MATIQEHLSPEEVAQLDAMRTAEPIESGATAPETPSPQPQDPGQQSATEAVDDAGEAGQPAAPKMVDIRALHEAREEIRRTRQERDEERRRMQMLEERTNVLLQNWQAQQQPKPAEPDAKTAIPDLAIDPVGHFLARQEALERQQATFDQQVRTAQAGAQQQQQQQQVVQAIMARTTALEHEFRAQHPDYDQAFNHLVTARHRELERLGVRDPARRAMIVQQDALAMTAEALGNGLNPAEVFYGYAQDRGFKGTAAQAENADPGSVPVQGSAVPPGQRLQNIAAGQQQARSLGRVPGNAPPPLTAQRLLEMSGADFDKMIKTPEGKALLGA